MNYEEFKNEFVDALQERLYERGNEVTISITNVEKMNESYEAITVTPEGSNIGMNLNLAVFAEAYENGVDFDEIVEQVTHKIEDHLSNMPTFDVQSLTDYEQMKDKISMEVVAADRNADLLAKVPHQEMEDMAVVYRFVVESDEAGRATILVTNELLNKMGVTPEQLHADALENAPELRPAVIKGMSEVMVDMMGPGAAEMFGIDEFPQDEMMYVATVPDKISGAGVIAYQEFMDQAAERLGGDFYILPSSVHEVLLVKDDGNANFRDLKAMVEEVNATQVAPEEKLTDSVYHYDSKEHIFELAEKFEARFGRSVAFGIGVNCGDAVVGNIGCEFRMDYTAIGDTVNTAARLESRAKAGQILISEKLYKALEDRIEAEQIGEMELKGKSNKIVVYNVTSIEKNH